MENILIRFATWIFRRYGYWFVAGKNENEIIGDDVLKYYTDTHQFFKLLKENKDGRF